MRAILSIALILGSLITHNDFSDAATRRVHVQCSASVVDTAYGVLRIRDSMGTLNRIIIPCNTRQTITLNQGDTVTLIAWVVSPILGKRRCADSAPDWTKVLFCEIEDLYGVVVTMRK